MKDRKSKAIATAVFIALGSGWALNGGAARGDDFWNNPAGGNWNVGANWSGGVVPTDANFNLNSTNAYSVALTTSEQPTFFNVLTDNVTINLNGFSVTIPSGQSIQPLNVGVTAGQIGTLTFAGTGSFDGATNINVGTSGGTGNLVLDNADLATEFGNLIVSNGSLTVKDHASINKSNGSLNMKMVLGDGAGPVVATIDNSSVVLPGGMHVGNNASLNLTNHASVSGGTFTFNFDVGGTAATPASITINNSSMDASIVGASNTTGPSIGEASVGSLLASNAGTFHSVYANPFVIGGAGGTGSIRATGLGSSLSLGVVDVGTDGANSPGTGTFQLDTKATGTVSTLKIAGGGTLKVLSGAQLNAASLDLSSAGTFDMTGGTINLTSNATLTAANFTVPATSALEGTGHTTGNVTNNGNVSPGDAPGIITINGNYLQAASAQLTIGLGGTTVGTQYDQLDVLGAATWNGTLDVVTLNNFVPSFGQSFDLFTVGSESGNFSTINLPTPYSSGTWDTSKLYTTGVITVVPEPLAIPALSFIGLSLLASRRRRKGT